MPGDLQLTRHSPAPAVGRLDRESGAPSRLATLGDQAPFLDGQYAAAVSCGTHGKREALSRSGISSEAPTGLMPASSTGVHESGKRPLDLDWLD